MHATLATVPLDASERVITAVAHAQDADSADCWPGSLRRRGGLRGRRGRDVVAAGSLFDRVRQAERDGRCNRELPIVWKAPDGTLIEGTINLAFEDLSGLTVVDFKTNRELSTDLERYRRQLTVYCQALGTLRNTNAKGILARI